MELLDAPLKLTCGGCGAQQAYSATDQALRCLYCASVTQIPQPAQAAPPGSAQAVVPLTVSEEALLDAVYEHLASGDLTPDDLLARATFVRKDRFYAPTFEFTGTYEAQWTASFGYDRIEQYTAYESRTENGRTRQVPVTKTRIVTDWRPASGHDAGRFQVRAYAGNRLSSTAQPSPALLALVEDAAVGTAVKFNAAYTVGVSQEAYACSPDMAYQQRGRDLVHACIDAGVERHGQGDRQRGWHWTADINKQHRAVLVPVCHVTYEYQGQPYNVWTSGIDLSQMVADKLPVDGSRVKLLAWGLAPLALTLVATPVAVEAAKEAGEEPVWPALMLVAAVAFAVWRYVAIVGHSVQRRQAFLAARRGGPGSTPGAAAKPTAASRLMMAATKQTTLVMACFMAVLVPLLLTVSWPDWPSFADEPVAEAAPAPRPFQPLPRRPQPEPAGAQAALAPNPEPTTAPPSAPPPSSTRPQDATVVGVLLAAKAKDWKAVDERLSMMKAAAPASYPNEIQALNDKAQNLMRRDENERAAQALARVVMLDPERPSAWANLTEVLTAQDAGLHALRVAVRLSTNRAKTVEYLRQAQENPPSENFAKLAAAVLLEIDQIPLHPKDTSIAPP